MRIPARYWPRWTVARSRVVHWLDFVLDDKLLRHRWYWLCCRLSDSSVWEYRCHCRRCEASHREFEEMLDEVIAEEATRRASDPL